VSVERVSEPPERSWVVGAREGEGGGSVEEKPVIDQRTMVFSRSALERIRSLWNATLKAC
jgi:hypothetical protein